MIIQGSRIVVGGVRETAVHVLRGPKNERISVLSGTEQDMLDAAQEARENGDKFALRHWKISPNGDMSRDDLDAILDDLAREFGADRQDMIVIEHHKKRSDNGQKNGIHWHVLAPERNRADKILSSSHSYARHEKIARAAELRLGHEVTRGRFNKSVAAALEAEGHSEKAQVIRHFASDGTTPKAAYTSQERRQFERKTGLDLPSIKQLVANAWSRSDATQSFTAALAEHGLSVRPGDKPGAWIVEKDGIFAGSLNRLVGVKAAEIQQFFEAPRKEKENVRIIESAPEKPAHAEGVGGRRNPEDRPRSRPGGSNPSHNAGSDRPNPSGNRSIPRVPDVGRSSVSGPPVGGTARGEQRRTPGNHDAATRNDIGKSAENGEAHPRNRAVVAREIRALEFAAKRHHVRLSELKKALSHGKPSFQPIDIAKSKENLKKLRSEFASMVYRDARARLDFRIQMNSQILRSMRASKLDWQHHKNWANSLKARLKADFRPPTDEQLLHHLTMKKHPAARELRLAIAMREVVGAIKATKKAKETLGFKPPYDADSLFPDAIKKDLEAREQKAVDRAKASLDAVLRLPTRSLFNPFSWKYPSACEHVAKRDIAQAELSRALLSQNLVSSMTGAYIAAEQERRKKINKTWVSESLRLNETRVLQFAVLQLAKDGDSQIQFALASGGTAKAAEILKERQIERTRVKAEEERIRREEEAKMCAAWASQTQRQALPEPTRPPPAPLGPSFGRGF